ncbi:hypothetical protein AV274_1914 [Blastocystis sp. ATCC 50177/Nand II]|uniref:Uncharacterized protein n=1 Tax=Blastocystis sp. subtype 1 (strain ATCC 50177 / NandII) TaxID=478820 RepID=A0A196SH81_BLAHN|nr:hypothetical protein AV274_1914 [Blastocystis sp. ATCC 50177/Nand II]
MNNEEKKEDTAQIDIENSEATAQEFDGNTHEEVAEVIEEPNERATSFVEETTRAHNYEEDHSNADSDNDSIDELCQQRKNEVRAPQRAPAERELPRYMRRTMSQAVREGIQLEENHRRSLAAMPRTYRPSGAITLPPIEEAPHFMRETMSYISLVASTPAKPRIHPSQIKEVDWKNRPRYMQETASYRHYTEKEVPRRPVSPKQIKEVDWEHKPHYMQPTKAYEQQVEKEPQPRTVSPKQIREVDWKNRPRYMQPTKAYEQLVAPVAVYSPRRVAAKQIREVDAQHLPRYMQLTKATKALPAVPAVPATPTAKPAKSVKPAKPAKPVKAATGKEELPHFMQSTRSCESALEKKKAEEERRRKQEEQKQQQKEALQALQARWKRNQTNLQAIRKKKE